MSYCLERLYSPFNLGQKEVTMCTQCLEDMGLVKSCPLVIHLFKTHANLIYGDAHPQGPATCACNVNKSLKIYVPGIISSDMDKMKQPSYGLNACVPSKSHLLKAQPPM